MKHLTENEKLFSKISFKRLKKLLLEKDIEILRFERSTNSYGEFLFITCIEKGNDITYSFYGCGLHEYRNTYLNDVFHFYSGNSVKVLFNNPIPLDKNKTLLDLEIEYNKYKKIELEDNRDEDTTFSMIADMADEDYAISNLY